MIQFINDLFNGSAGAWSGGIAHSVIILSLVIALGKFLAKIKIRGVSLGGTWILFLGLAFAHFGMSLDHDLLHFMKEFGLILFVYSIGLQVGPGFFASFKSGGLAQNGLAVVMVLLTVAVTWVLYKGTGLDAPTLTGIMTGAVTNTPSLGAAQQAFTDATGAACPQMGMAYAVAYPLGMVGCILSFILIRKVFYKVSPAAPAAADKQRKLQADDLRMPTSDAAQSPAPESPQGAQYLSRRIIISKRKLNGLALGQLHLGDNLGVTVTRIRRAGIELRPTERTLLQYGDQVTIAGTPRGVAAVERILGNSRKRLDEPNLVPIFIGIALGCVLGSIPLFFPGIPQPVKLGLAGGPLVVSLLISHFGPRFRVVTYVTASANLMLREVGISLFLACVGLEAGGGFVDALLGGGLRWVLYGAIITLVPLLLGSALGRWVLRLPLHTLLGVLSGSCTNPPALAFAAESDPEDSVAVGYATVYPLAMFCRVLAAQLLIIFLL